jgi:hypothetical protein
VTTVQHIETLLAIARHIEAHGGPVEALLAAKRRRNYEWAIAVLRRCA